MKKTILILLCLTLSAFVLRLFLVQYRQCIDVDGISYVSVARELFEDHHLSNRFSPPGYPFFIGLVSYIVHDYEFAGRLVSAILGALLVIPTFFLGKEIYDKRIGLIASILVVVHPALTDYSTRVLTESMFTLLLALFLWISIMAIKTGRGVLYILSGMLIGMAYLTRPEAFGFIPYFIAGSIVIRFLSKNNNFKVPIINLGLFLLVSMFFILPYAVFVGGLSGKTGIQLAVWGETVGEENIMRAVDIQTTKYNPDESPSLIGEIIRHPIKMAKRWIINLHIINKYIFPALFPTLLLIAIGVGLLQVRFSLNHWKELYIVFSWFPYIFVLFFYIEARFFLPLIPVSLILGARGIEFIGNRLLNKISPSPLIHYIVLIAILLSLLPYTFRPIYRTDECSLNREVGIWIKEYIKPPIKIIDRDPRIAFYSSAERIGLPIGDYDKLIQYAYKENATHLIIENRSIPVVRFELTFLLSKSHVPPELKLINEFRRGNHTILLYKIIRKDDDIK